MADIETGAVESIPSWMGQLPDRHKGNETISKYATTSDFAAAAIQTMGGDDTMLDADDEAPGWMATLPDEYKRNALMSAYPSIGELADDFLGWAEQETDDQVEETADDPEPEKDEADPDPEEGQPLARPSEDASEAEWRQYYTENACPDSPYGYKYENQDQVDQMIDQFGLDRETLGELERGFRELAYDIGLDEYQYNEIKTNYFNRLVDQQQRAMAAQAEAQQQAVDHQVEELKNS